MNGRAGILLSLMAATAPFAAAQTTGSLAAAGEEARGIVAAEEHLRTPVPEGGALVLEDPFRQSITLIAPLEARWKSRSGGRVYLLSLPFGRGVEVQLSSTGTAKAEREVLELVDPFGRSSVVRPDGGGTLLVERRWAREARLLDRSGRTVLEIRLPAGGRVRVEP